VLVARARAGTPRNTSLTRRGQAPLVYERAFESAEDALGPLLEQLAALVIRLGITPRYVSNTITTACVRHAAKNSRLLNGRVNQSRVAVLTGLSRAEVRRELRQVARPKHGPNSRQHRAWRLINGWLSDPRFRTSSGEPRPIKLGEGKGNLGGAVRKFCGDVPAKAVLLELLKMQAVKLADDHIILSRRVAAQLSSKVFQARAVLRTTSETLDRLQKLEAGNLPVSRFATIRVSDDVERDVLLRQADQSLQLAIDAIREIGERPITYGKPRRRGRPRELYVSATAVAFNK